MRNLILSCLFGAFVFGHGLHTAEAGRGRGIKLVSMKQRNSVNPFAPDGTIVVTARFTGKNALARAGAFIASANQGYSTGSRHGGVIAKMKTRRDGVVQVKATALPQVKGQLLQDLSALVGN